MRYNQKFIKARFGMAMDAIGVPHGDTWTKQADGSHKANVGTYFINNYHGRQVCKVHNEGGAQSTPFGSSRYTASEFIAHLDGILGAAHVMRMQA